MSLHKKTKSKKIYKAPNQEAESETPVAKPKLSLKKIIRKWIIRIVLIVLLLVVLIPLGVYITQPNYYKVLVIGSDQRDSEHARSDVLMIVTIPKSDTGNFSMIMIPRDTKIEHEEKGLEKITHFYAMWEDEDEYLGNKELTQSVVEDLLDIKVDGTVEVTFDSFIEIVDMLGGVDTSSGHLDGAEAKEVVYNRFNKQGGAFGRADAQRDILRNLMTRVKNPVSARLVYEYFMETDRARLDINTTDLACFGVAYVIGHKGNVSLGEVEEVVLPGSGQRIYTPDFGKELYYWVLDEVGTNEIVDQYLK